MAKKLTNYQKHQREKAIKSMALEGIARDTIYKRLQAIGLGGRRTDVLKKARGYQQIPEKRKSIATVGDLKRIGKESYTVVSEFFTETWRYTMEYTLYRPDTGEEVKWYTTLNNPTEMRPGQIKAEAMKALAKWGAFYKHTIRGAHIEIAEHDPNEPWG